LASRKGKALGREAYAGEGNQGFRKRVWFEEWFQIEIWKKNEQ
jgi:hypothetical protein